MISHKKMQPSATSSDVYIEFEDEQRNTTAVYEQRFRVGSLQRESGECKEIQDFLNGQETRYSIKQVEETPQDLMQINNSEFDYTDRENDD